ncbi:MAG: ribonuclease III [Solirubrobacterales bacterium]
MSAGASRLLELVGGLAPDLKSRVFTHSSWADDRNDAYERLAFLGDAVLGVVVADVLLKENAESTAGDLTKIRAQAASRAACARVARELGVPERLAANAPTSAELPIEDVIGAQSVLAEVCEAAIGAVFEQYGFEQTEVAVADAFADEIANAEAHPADFKSRLQEFLARRGQKPEYAVIDSEGPPHNRRFVCAVEIRGDRYGTGTGRSKKEAEQSAAEATLAQLEATDD